MCHIEENVHGFFPDLYINYQNYKQIKKYINEIEKYKFLKNVESKKLIDLVKTVLNYIHTTEQKNKKVNQNYFIEEYYKKYKSFAYSIMVRSSLLFFYYSNNYFSIHAGNSNPLETAIVKEELSTNGYRKKLSTINTYSSNYNIVFIFISFFIFFFILLYFYT